MLVLAYQNVGTSSYPVRLCYSQLPALLLDSRGVGQYDAPEVSDGPRPPVHLSFVVVPACVY